MKCGVDMSNTKTTTKTIIVGKQKDGHHRGGSGRRDQNGCQEEDRCYDAGYEAGN